MSVETVVLDAGGRYGMHPTWKGFGGELRYVMFEPDPAEASRLKDKYAKDSRVSVQELALGEKPGEVVINVLSHHGQSSLFAPNPDSNWFSKTRPNEGLLESQYKANLTSIDVYCAENGLAPDFLKSDTEGSEMLVLAGAEQQLQGMLGLRCETQFESVFIGAPTFAEIYNFLTKRGFILLNFDYAGRGSPCNQYFTGDRYGILTGTDAVWVRKPEEILRWSGDGEVVAARAAKYAIFCFANGSSDLAMHMLLLATHENANLFNSIQGSKLLAVLKVTVQRLFYQLLQHPAYNRFELETTYSGLFCRELKRCHEFFESNEFNPN